MSFKMDRALFTVIAPGVMQRISDSATIHDPGKVPHPVKDDGGFCTILWEGSPFVSEILDSKTTSTKKEAAEVFFKDEVPAPIESDDEDSIVEDDEESDEEE